MEQLLETYFTETQREARGRIWSALESDPGIGEERLEALRQLRALRYGAKLRGRPLEDAFLDALMELLQIDNQAGSGFGWKRLQAQMIAVGERLGLDRFREGTEAARECFVREYGNTALLFAGLGADDRAYRSGIFHLAGLNEKKYQRKLARDLEAMGCRLPEKFGLTGYYRPLRQGMAAALLALCPEYDGVLKTRNE